MRKIFRLLIPVVMGLLFTGSIFAQAPQKMSYQAVIRDGNNYLITNQVVGMQISILQNSANGTEVYVETQTPTTNENGLISIEIGDGTIVSGNFSTIDWSDGTYFIKSETDPAGGSSYSISGTSQLLSVPYALHATTAETVTGGISETDPFFSSSDAASITATDITNLGNLSGANTGDQDISGIAINTQAIQDTAAQLRADLTAVNGGFASETDPVFENWDKSTGISISETQITDLTHFTNSDETDPVFSASAAEDISETDITNWNNKLDSYTETDPRVPTGTQTGEIQYWNGTAWITLAAGREGQILTMSGGIPSWMTLLQPGEVENPATGKIWMDRNLGASRVATSSSDADAYGDLYQWGRAADGHESRTSTTTSTLSSTDTPGDDLYITNFSNPNDWRATHNDNLWQGVDGINNPCPSGYRIPTEAEWEAEMQSWNSINTANAFNSPLKLPAGGGRNYSYGALGNVGTSCLYWSSTVSGGHARSVLVNGSTGNMTNTGRANGRSVRCIKD